MKEKILMSASALLFTAGMGIAQAGVDPKAAEAIAEAVEAADQAEEAGFIWKSTRKIIGQAKESAKKGETDKAIELADKAETQAELALQQAKKAEEIVN